MDTGNAIETKEEANQPVDSVVENTEATEAKPQAEATEEQELYVDDSSDGQESSHKNEMSQAQAYAAFQKKKKQSAQRKKDLEAEQEKANKLQAELDELKATVGKITKGKPPTLEQFDYDESQYQNAVKEYYSAPETTTTKANKAEPEQASNPVNDEAEFYLYQREQELTKKVPGYDAAKSNVTEILAKKGLTDTSGAINYLSAISKQKGVDIAKVIFAIDKSPKIIDDLLAAGNNAFAVADILSNAESKVKTRSKKKIDSEPEPNITNSGAINSNSEKVNQARKKWIDNPSAANYNAYQSAKNKKGE